VSNEKIDHNDEEAQAACSAFNAEMGRLRDYEASQSWDEFNTDASPDGDDDPNEPSMADFAVWDAEIQRDDELNALKAELENPYISYSERKALQNDQKKAEEAFEETMKRIKVYAGARRWTKEKNPDN